MITILTKKKLKNLILTQNLITGKTANLPIHIQNKIQKIKQNLHTEEIIMNDITVVPIQVLLVQVMPDTTEHTTTDRAIHHLEVHLHGVQEPQGHLLAADIQLTAISVIQVLHHIITILETHMALVVIPIQVQKVVI